MHDTPVMHATVTDRDGALVWRGALPLKYVGDETCAEWVVDVTPLPRLATGSVLRWSRTSLPPLDR